MPNPLAPDPRKIPAGPLSAGGKLLTGTIITTIANYLTMYWLAPLFLEPDKVSDPLLFASISGPVAGALLVAKLYVWVTVKWAAENYLPPSLLAQWGTVQTQRQDGG